MRDYFAALAVRTLRPELGVQPRHRVRWEEVPEPPVEAFVAMAHDAAAARSQQPVQAEPAPRSNRQGPETDAPGSERVAPRSRRRQSERHPVPDHDESGTAAIAPAPRKAARAEDPAIPVRAERLKTGHGQPPAIKSHEFGESRASATAGSRRIARVTQTPARLSTRDRDPSTSEPAIRIHIGRIDVRAVTTAAPARSAPRERTRALMSLDEYVQKRDRGAS
jgi:hypothetical protein